MIINQRHRATVHCFINLRYNPAVAAEGPAEQRCYNWIRGMMTDGRGFGFSESCLRMFFRRDGVLDADDDFSGKDIRGNYDF
jgi:hypothetical protein